MANPTCPFISNSFNNGECRKDSCMFYTYDRHNCKSMCGINYLIVAASRKMGYYEQLDFPNAKVEKV